MAGQGIDRREALRMMATASVAAQFSGFSRWAFACEHVQAETVQIKSGTYSPQFFTEEEFRVVNLLSEMIIPSDESPGAREAGASEFIDFMVSVDTPLQYRFRYGLIWLDAHSQHLHSKRFSDLQPAQQSKIMRHLAYKKDFRDGEEDGRVFFKLIREYTVMGFYTSRIGLEELDYPGLKFYPASPACPHTEDREHKHLAVPKA